VNTKQSNQLHRVYDAMEASLDRVAVERLRNRHHGECQKQAETLADGGRAMAIRLVDEMLKNFTISDRKRR